MGYNKRKEETVIGANMRAIFSSNLRKIREEAKLSQINLAEKADLAPNFINAIENGKKWISPESLGRLAKSLEVEPYQFFLTDSKWNTQGKEYLSLFISDIEKVSKDYRERYLDD